jgi:hypothetical protein
MVVGHFYATIDDTETMRGERTIFLGGPASLIRARAPIFDRIRLVPTRCTEEVEARRQQVDGGPRQR